MGVKRFGVSLEEELLEKLDMLVAKHQFPSRSQAIRFLVHNSMVRDKWADDQEVAGALVLIYDHHRRDLQNKLTRIQHDYHCLILSGQHVHLDHDNCLETITVKGKASKLLKLSDKLKAVKGIKHGELVMSTSR
jgi:CopG family nickel-responsive transcriptional regulator